MAIVMVPLWQFSFLSICGLFLEFDVLTLPSLNISSPVVCGELLWILDSQLSSLAASHSMQHWSLPCVGIVRAPAECSGRTQQARGATSVTSVTKLRRSKGPPAWKERELLFQHLSQIMLTVAHTVVHRWKVNFSAEKKSQLCTMPWYHLIKSILELLTSEEDVSVESFQSQNKFKLAALEIS